MTSTYDAIVVGGGHNGLVSGAYLARSGARTLVLEGRHKTGGAATTETPWPDAPEFKVTRLSYVMSLLPPTIMRELDLVRHGYKVYPMGPYYQAFPEGGSIKIFADDAKRNYEEIAKWSKKDAEAMPLWDAWIAGLADVLGPLLLTVPPAIGSRKPADLRDTLRLAWRHRGLDVRTIADVTRLMTMSIADLLDDWFESWQVKAPIAVNGVIGTWAGPCEPGTAYVMAHHSIGDIGDGHLGNWGFPEGGMGAVADAIERSARSFGAEIRTDARVNRTMVSNGRVRGVVLENGEEILAPVVVTTLHPQRAFLDHVASSELPDDFVKDIERWKTRSGVVKINLALSELPNFTADPGTDLAEHHTGSVEMAPSIEYMERAFQDAREGRGRRAAVQRRRDPHHLRQDAVPRRHPHHVAVHPVGPEGVERDPARRGPRGLRRPDDRLLQRGGPQLQGVHPPPRRGRPLRDGARVRAHRREHLPRRALARAAVPHAPGARLRRLPDTHQGPLQRGIGHPRRRRRVRHPRMAGGQGGAGRPAVGAGDRRPSARSPPSRGDPDGRERDALGAAIGEDHARGPADRRRRRQRATGELRRAAGGPRSCRSAGADRSAPGEPALHDTGRTSVRGQSGRHRRSGRPGAAGCARRRRRGPAGHGRGPRRRARR